MNIEKAIDFVQRHGNIIEKARLSSILWNKPAPDEAMQALRKLQKPDGGFGFWMPGASNLCDTAFILLWLDDLHVHKGPIADPACHFILARQQRDGGWDEVNAILPFDPPEWMAPGRIETQIWLTGFCAHALIRFGYAEAEGATCPSDFLVKYMNDAGRLAGYFRATWIALPMFSYYPGMNSEPFKKALANVEANYSEEWQDSYLTWLLRCLQDAKLPGDHPLVIRCLEDLARKQRTDGGWDSEDGSEHDVSTTVEALRAYTLAKPNDD